MKINEKYYSVIEWSIAVVLVVICFKYYILAYGSFSPLKAHQISERTFHYGPSKIVKTIDLSGGKIYLCKYKDWFSADTVKKGLVRWYPGDNVGGSPIDYSKQVSYSWGNSHIKKEISIMTIYGYVSDPNISVMVLERESGATTLRYNLDKSKMFIFNWNENEHKYKIKYLRGLNKKGKVIYEKKFMGM